MALGGDQMTELPGDVVRIGHGAHQDFFVGEVVEVAVHQKVGDAERRANCVFEIHVGTPLDMNAPVTYSF